MPTPPRAFTALTTPTTLTAHPQYHPYCVPFHSTFLLPIACIFLNIGKFKGCQCMPTPPRALTALHPQHPHRPQYHPYCFPHHSTFPLPILTTALFKEYLKAANACPCPPAHSTTPIASLRLPTVSLPPTALSLFMGCIF